jgi:hypothetical protein
MKVLAAQWRILVDAATVVWLVFFVFTFLPNAPLNTAVTGRIGLGLLGVFIADLGVTYYRSGENPWGFVRHHWFDILLVIPYFRIFRVLRAVRALRLLRLVQQPRPAATMRLIKTMLNIVRAVKKGRRAAKETSALSKGGTNGKWRYQ